MRRWGAVGAAALLAGCFEAGGGGAAAAAPECTNDAACASLGQICEEQRCVAPRCTGPGSCASGSRCDLETMRCGECFLRSCGPDYPGLCGDSYPDGCDGTLNCSDACGDGVACDPATARCDCRPLRCEEQAACGSYEQGCGGPRLHCEHVCVGASCTIEQQCGCEAGLDGAPDCPGAGEPCGAGACPVCRCAAGLVCSNDGRCERFSSADCLTPVQRCGVVEGIDCGACAAGESCVLPIGVCRPAESTTCFQLDGRIEDPGQLGGNLIHASEAQLGGRARLYFGAFTEPFPTTTLWSVMLDEQGAPDWSTRRSESQLDRPYDGGVSSPLEFSADGLEVVVTLDKPLGTTLDAEMLQAILASPRRPSDGHLPSRTITTLDTLARPDWLTSVYAPTLLPDGRTLLYYSDFAEPNLDYPYGMYSVRRASRRIDDAVFGESPSDAPVRIHREETLLNPDVARVRPSGMTADLQHVLLLTSPFGGPSRLVRAALSYDADGRPVLGPNEEIELRGAPEPTMLWSASMSPDGRRVWAMFELGPYSFGVFRFVPCD